MKVCAIVLLAVIALAEGANLPSYFQRCHLKDDNAKKCLTDSVNNGWPQLVAEDNSWNELPIAGIEHEILNILNGTLSNANLIGLANIHFEEINVNTKKRIVSVIFTCPQLSIVGTTNITGNILGLGINENSPVNATYYGGVYNFRFSYQLETRDEEQYIKINKQELLYNVDRLAIDLRIPDQTRASRANKLFNDNWKFVNAIGSDITAKLIGDTISTKIQEFLHDIPFNTLFE